MFGVLVVEDEQGQLGYLAAYSGLLSERNDWPYFVPPVYDLLKPNGCFQVHEADITQLNQQILELEKKQSVFAMNIGNRVFYRPRRKPI